MLLGILDAKIQDLSARRFVIANLRARLRIAKRVLDDGNDVNDVCAVRSHSRFVRQVDRWTGTKILIDEASDLIARAEANVDLVESP